MAKVYYNVMVVSQGLSPVCWLACAAMIIQYKRHYTPSAAQLGQLADDFRLASVPAIADYAGALRRLGFAVTHASGIHDPHALTMRHSARPSPGRGLSATPDGDVIFALLQNYGPFMLNHMVGSFWYGPGVTVPAGHAAHAVVVTGIDTGTNTVYFNNPWGIRDVPTTTSSVVHAIRRYDRPGQYSIAYLPG